MVNLSFCAARLSPCLTSAPFSASHSGVPGKSAASRRSARYCRAREYDCANATSSSRTGSYGVGVGLNVGKEDSDIGGLPLLQSLVVATATLSLLSAV